MLVSRLWPLGITQIACGDSHSCALAHDGRVFCWGRGKYGQLGSGSFENGTLPQHVKLSLAGQQVTGMGATPLLCGGLLSMCQIPIQAGRLFRAQQAGLG